MSHTKKLKKTINNPSLVNIYIQKQYIVQHKKQIEINLHNKQICTSDASCQQQQFLKFRLKKVVSEVYVILAIIHCVAVRCNIHFKIIR